MAASDVTITLTCPATGKTFVIDNKTWHIPSDGLDGFGSLTATLNEQQAGASSGGLVTGMHVGITQRTVTVEAVPSRELRDQAIAFFVLGLTYEATVIYMGSTRTFSGVCSNCKLSEGNIYRPMELTFSFDCTDPYLYGETASKSLSAEVSAYEYNATFEFGEITGLGHYPSLLRLSGTYTSRYTTKLGYRIGLEVKIERPSSLYSWVPETTMAGFVLQPYGASISAGTVYDYSINWTPEGLVTSNGYPPLWASGYINWDYGQLTEGCTLTAGITTQSTGTISAATATASYVKTYGVI